jgi:hypothetical protein
MNIELRPASASDKQRWFELWQGYLDFYKTVLSTEQSELTWSRIMDPEFNDEGWVSPKTANQARQYINCAKAIMFGLMNEERKAA